MIPSFLCPTDSGPLRDSQGIGLSSYVGVHHDVEAPIAADNHGVLFLNSQVRYEGVTDGISMTLFVGETIHDGLGLGWASGTRAQPQEHGSDGRQRTYPDARSGCHIRNEWGRQGGPASPWFVGGFSSAHPGVFNFAMGDGSVRTLSKSINATILKQLAHRADGELIDESIFGYLMVAVIGRHAEPALSGRSQ